MTAREALKELRDNLEIHLKASPMYSTDHCTINSAEVAAMIAEADEALAKPERNCNVGTVEEQMKKFRLFCESHKPAESEFTETGELLCPASGCELGVCNYGQCALKWAQMPYEA